MQTLYVTKAEIVKGTSKKGNDYYATKIYLTKDYAKFDVLQNADLELVKSMTKDSNIDTHSDTYVEELTDNV